MEITRRRIAVEAARCKFVDTKDAEATTEDSEQGSKVGDGRELLGHGFDSRVVSVPVSLRGSLA
jgi:hypothetical protein